ncbi:ABC transporter permease [Virgibacillus sp. 179-BFC.A HS]|uniref:ABC transporter permease n=1 Tax=Tigheibacillus jepli TaxID=3035914 RepID=A0ABU5CKU0_9BACI|nr:ABC transporter permease [Virgibacillus sp. 179-BFC.A HS]MDY0406936.1 ABC transporter permease [Virgibacillus sp. 179-BFC.A HS]
MFGIAIAFIAFGQTHSQSLAVGIVNEDPGKITDETIDYLHTKTGIDVQALKRDKISEALTSGNVDAVITIEKGFAEGILRQHPGHITVVSIKGNSVTAMLKATLYQYMDNLVALSTAANGDAEQFTMMYEQYKQTEFGMQTTEMGDLSRQFNMTQTAIGFLIMIMMISASNLSEIILKEKQERTYYRLLASPITTKTYITANLLVNMIVMIIQFLLTLLILTGVFHINLGIPFWEICLVMLLFSIISVGLSLVIITFANSRSAVGALKNLIIIPTTMLSGCFWPYEIMPKVAQRIAEFLPQRWILKTLTQMQEGSAIENLYMNFLVLFAFALAFFLIAAYRFSRNNSTKNFI